LSNVIFAGVKPKHEIPSIVASADVCLAILQDIPMFRTTYPNKVFDYMAAGKATVLVIDGVIRKVIEDSQGGVFINPGDDQQLAAAILELSNNPEKIKQMGHNARTYLINNLDREKMMDQTRTLFQKLVKVK
jgi:glycosyltransferase involved in cell wall biosynthesis